MKEHYPWVHVGKNFRHQYLFKLYHKKHFDDIRGNKVAIKT